MVGEFGSRDFDFLVEYEHATFKHPGLADGDVTECHCEDRAVAGLWRKSRSPMLWTGLRGSLRCPFHGERATQRGGLGVRDPSPSMGRVRHAGTSEIEVSMSNTACLASEKR